ncbi:hypothetical protein F4775DRAFT_437940 [Biscogniauxia sp. FL1348]|nr:hypothetical protein F4775DRAFT_437940 [Biscogniauxia sp. FL1348]
MDQLAPVLLAFPPENRLIDNDGYDKAVKIHLSRLTKLLKDNHADLVLHGSQLLELLNPAVNSLSYLAVLHTLVIPAFATSAARDLLLEKLVIFLVSFDGRQCRYAGTHLQDLFGAVGSGQCLPPSVAVEALATAILKLDPTGSMLTSSHVILARLAYNTNNIEPALQVIDKNIVFYPGMANHRDPQYLCDLNLPPPAYITRENGLTAIVKAASVMEYDLLCGMMYCARREWEKAHAAFERVVTFPTREGGASKIMVEAYKKWVLVGLLLNGKLADPPSYTGATANKLYGTLGKPYTSVAASFVTENAEALKMEVGKNAELWQEDGNTGLLQEVLAAYQKWRVLSLQDIYTKISIPEIREQTLSAETGEKLGKDEDVEALVQNMIIGGMLKGVIEKNDDGTVFLTFLSASTELSEQEFANELARTALRLKQLQPIFKATNERLGTSKDYIKHVMKESKRNEKSDVPDPTLGFDAQVDDEDLMGGVVPTG